jgi:hypothetical protein
MPAVYNDDQVAVMERTLRVLTFDEHSKGNADLEYWLTRPPEERVNAVEQLRRQHHGTGVRLQRVLRVTEREPR